MDRPSPLDDLRKQATNLPLGDEAERDALCRKAEMVIRNLFGEASKYLEDLSKISFYPRVVTHLTDSHDRDATWDAGRRQLLNLLHTMEDELRLFADPADMIHAGQPRPLPRRKVSVARSKSMTKPPGTPRLHHSRLSVIVRLAVVLIPALATMVVGYWQFGRHSPTPPASIPVPVLVVDQSTERAIRGALVTVERHGVPLVTRTDSEGITSFVFEATESQVRIHVTAEGYAPYDRTLDRVAAENMGALKLASASQRAVGNSTVSLSGIAPPADTSAGSPGETPNAAKSRPVDSSTKKDRPNPIETRSASVPAREEASSPRTPTLAVTPSVDLPLRLVTGNHTRLSIPIGPYYITTKPVPMAALRAYARSNPTRTPIPDSAKDTDPISEIYYEDAIGIATALNAQLPNQVEWINAYGAGIIGAHQGTELIQYEKELATVQDDAGQGNTYLSSAIRVSVWPHRLGDPPARGVFRLVKSTEAIKRD
jgi:hypothetical protein